MHVLSSFQRTGFLRRRSPSTFLSSGEPCNLTNRSRSCQPPPNIFFRIFFQRRAAVPGGLCADWVGLANPRFPGSKCVVGKTNIRIRLKGVNPLRSRGPICQKSVADYTTPQRRVQAQRKEASTNGVVPDPLSLCASSLRVDRISRGAGSRLPIRWRGKSDPPAPGLR